MFGADNRKKLKEKRKFCWLFRILAGKYFTKNYFNNKISMEIQIMVKQRFLKKICSLQMFGWYFSEAMSKNKFNFLRLNLFIKFMQSN